MKEENRYNYEYLKEPIPIIEQVWDEGTVPLVTTQTMTFKHEKYIRDCIEGILMQKTTFPVQVLIHDDASTDKTAEIIKEYTDQYPNVITAYFQKENTYTKPDKHEKRKPFLDLIEGKYIALCEGDDFWIEPYKLQKQVDILENKKNDTLIGVFTNSASCDKNGNIINKKELCLNKYKIINLHDFFKHKIHYPTPTVVFKNELSDIIPNLAYMRNPYLGDWILWILLHLKGDFYFLDEQTACYRVHGNSLTHTVNAVKRWKYDFIIRKQLKEILPAEYHSYLKEDWYAYLRIATAYRKQKKQYYFFWYLCISFFSNPKKFVNAVLNSLK